MELRKLILLFTCLLFYISVNGQRNTPEIKLGLESQFLVLGEFNSSYNFIGGARISYYFSEKKFTHLNISSGVSTNLGPMHARMWTTDLSLGYDFNITEHLYIISKVGLQYINENQVHFTLDQRLDWLNNSLGITGKLGIGARLGRRINTQVFFNQFNTVYSSIGLACNFSF